MPYSRPLNVLCTDVLTTGSERSEPLDSLTDSPEWSRKYDVFSISRLYLVHSLAFTYEQVRMLSVEDMFYIADVVRDHMLHGLVADFDDEVCFVTSIVLAEKGAENGQL
jgi:hypothetical protein